MSSLSRPALLIIDIQVGLLHGPEAPMPGPRPWPTSIAWARRPAVPLSPAGGAPHGPAGSPIAAGSPFWQLAPELVVGEADRVFDKQRPSAFHGTGLDGWLNGRRADPDRHRHEDPVLHRHHLPGGGRWISRFWAATTGENGYTGGAGERCPTCMDTPQLTAPRSSPIQRHPGRPLRAADEQRRGVRGARPPFSPADSEQKGRLEPPFFVHFPSRRRCLLALGVAGQVTR